ncbi:MAG: SGNH/GDSL hydrolase family protein [Acidobacteriota bacterium]
MTIRHRRYFGLIFAAFVLAFALKLDSQEKPRHLRVLFIGNSYTYFNNLPEIFRKLAQAGNQGDVGIGMIAPGGWRLKDHWEKGDALEVLHQSKWNIVVLQEQSTLGVNYYVDGRIRIAGDQIFRPYAEQWISEVRSAGATPILYLTWAREATPEDQAALNYVYMRAAKDFRSQVAPVGIAWERLRKEQPSLELFYADGSHPSPAGSYVAACTFYAAIFHQSPVGLPGTISGIPVNLQTAKAESSINAVLVDLPPELAHAIQQAAWEAWQEIDKAGGHLNLAPVPVPALPPLMGGDPLAAAELEGTWSGDLKFYPPPFLPTQMELTLHREGNRWKAHLALMFHSSEQPDQSLDLSNCRVDTQQLSFTDPKAPQKLSIRFRGVKGGPGELRGQAEARSATPDSTVRLLGTWQLRKK